jgi:addiction module HigA family antidote
MTLSPGETLLREVLEPLNIRPEDLALATWMSTACINRILSGELPISPEAAIRFEAALGEKAETLLAQQASYDLERVRESVDVSQMTLLNANLRKDLLKIKLQKLYDFHMDQKTPVDMVELNRICMDCDIDVFFEMMLEVDPNRSLFDTPIGKSERGLHGLPLLKNRFRFCTDNHGDLMEGENAEVPMNWRKVAGLHTQESRLNRSIRIAFDNEASQYCFIQIMMVDPRAVPVKEDMDKLAEQFGANVEAFASPGVLEEPANVYLVAFDYEAKLNALDDMAWDQIGLKQRWAVGL